jgi:hypothetical protein
MNRDYIANPTHPMHTYPKGKWPTGTPHDPSIHRDNLIKEYHHLQHLRSIGKLEKTNRLHYLAVKLGFEKKTT